MSDIRTIPDTVLEAEIKRRQRLRTVPPVPLEQPDFTKVVKTVIEALAKSIDENYEDEDL